MVDPIATLSKALILALAVPVLLLARDDFAAPQFHILLLSSLYGACVLLSAESFLVLFLGLELMSLPVYVLVLLAFRRPECAEAALKYLVLGGNRFSHPADGCIACCTVAQALWTLLPFAKRSPPAT